jgi:serine/threonine protein kinase
MSAEQTGGALLDEGGYGCVFMPPLLCINEKRDPSDKEGGRGLDGKLDKVLRLDDAEKEYIVAKEIQKIPLWQQYFSVPESMCTPAPASKQTETSLQDCTILNKMPLGRLRILRSNYAGTPLNQLRIQINTFSFRSFMIHLLEGAALMALFGVVHCDLHFGNVLIDKANVPRIIDFNRGISIHQIKDVRAKMGLIYYGNRDLIQVSPDWALLCGRMDGIDKDTILADLFETSVWLKKIQAFLGIMATSQRESLETFYAKSRSAQTADLTLWFKSYWRLVDSWAIGNVLINTLLKLLLWPSFQATDYSRHATQIKTVLSKMTAVSPLERIDSVQALALLDPGNYILRKYAGDWLEKVGS